jgi:5-hydroxyisourate hydrolase-like protein (transthyretin family)
VSVKGQFTESYLRFGPIHLRRINQSLLHPAGVAANEKNAKNSAKQGIEYCIYTSLQNANLSDVHCRVTFETEEYMRACKSLHPAFYAEKPFYPAAAVQFEILPSQTRQHFHIPLTWNPYGYSTYRGS